MRCELCTLAEIPECTFVVALSRYQDGWLFSRHRDRDTWETQGGHIEPGETPAQAARRELYEESGAAAKALTPLCGYWAEREGRPRRYGMLFLAEIESLAPLPASEMAEVRRFDALPAALTYPDITPHLYAYALRWLQKGAES